MFNTTETKTGFTAAIQQSARADFRAAAWGVVHMLAAEAEEVSVSEAKQALKEICIKAGFVDAKDKKQPSAKAKHILAVISGGFSRYAKAIKAEATAEENAEAVYTAMIEKYRAKAGDAPSFAAMFKALAGGQRPGAGKKKTSQTSETEAPASEAETETTEGETVSLSEEDFLSSLAGILPNLSDEALATVAAAVNAELVSRSANEERKAA